MNEAKPSGTSAASTAFCAAKIEGPGGFLWVDGNGKITRANGTLADPRPNAFSLLHREDCPGMTTVCEAICYSDNLRQFASKTYLLYLHNSRMIRDILLGPDAPRNRTIWAALMADWITWNARGGFRWHVLGDVWSVVYARWIARVCQLAPEVPFWIYLRNLDPSVIEALYEVSTNRGYNLAINLSCDVDNYDHARRIADRYDLRCCYLTVSGTIPDDLRDHDVIFPEYRLRGGNAKGAEWFVKLDPRNKKMVCPVDFNGKTENRRCGPCDRCLK